MLKNHRTSCPYKLFSNIDVLDVQNVKGLSENIESVKGLYPKCDLWYSQFVSSQQLGHRESQPSDHESYGVL